MNLPSTIRVGYRDYAILDLPWQGTDINERFGDCDVNHSVIRVSTAYGPVRAGNVLLHETLHAAYDAAHLTDKSKEEQIVTGLADVMSQVWRDNPDFVEFVTAALAGAE